VRIVDENTSPMKVIIEPAIVDISCCAPDGEPP